MVTKKQIAALRYLIFNAKDANPLSKQILALLIERSEKLTKDVCISLVQGHDGYSAREINDAAHGLGAMASSVCTTHLDALCKLMGTKLFFSVHYGDFDPERSGDPFNNSGQFSGAPLDTVDDPELAREDMPMRYTFWLAKKVYSRQAELVKATRDDLEKIDIKKSGLYPGIEK